MLGVLRIIVPWAILWLGMGAFSLIAAMKRIHSYKSQTNRTYNHQHIRSTGQRSFETAVRQYDKDIFHAILHLIDRNKIDVRGFYHVSTAVPQWREVLEEHLMIMDGKRFQSNLFHSKMRPESQKAMRITAGWSNVLDLVDSVHITFEGDEYAYRNMSLMMEELNVRSAEGKIHIEQFNRTQLHIIFPDVDISKLSAVLGEIQTINELHAFCSHHASLDQQGNAFAPSSSSRQESPPKFVFFTHNQETDCAIAAGGGRRGVGEGGEIGSNRLRRSAHHHHHHQSLGHKGEDEEDIDPLLAANYAATAAAAAAGGGGGGGIDEPFFLQDLVNSFIIEFPSICLSALIGGYSTCGTDFSSGGVYDTNIWW